jgi:excinuclease ABC subunit C
MDKQSNKNILDIVKNLPQVPGVYRYYDAEGIILYVGKAKNLRNRVNSYFQKDLPNFKTYRLVKQIAKIEYTVVDSEFDALLLENNLIKEFQPKYNILLKDDKTYPYICVTHEPFPRIFSIRRVDKKLGRYFGPFSNLKAMYNVLELVKKLYNVRSCTLALTPESIAQNKFKLCLEYHIKNCKAPCEGLQTLKDYQADIEQVIHILKGNLGVAKNYFIEKMNEAAQNLAFETAQAYKEKLDSLENFQSKSLVSNPNISDVDVCTIEVKEEEAYMNFLHIEHGMITQAQTLKVKKKLDEKPEEILLTMLLEIRQQVESKAPKVITNIDIDFDFKGVEFQTPKIGDLKKLVDLSLKNIAYYQKDRLEKQPEKAPTYQRILEQLQNDLQLKKLPQHIECFDNSNIQGTNPVSAMVCFKNAKPSKKDYRHYKVQTVVGANDFATMYEVVTRRYKKLKEENLPFPDLIIIDGGKGQLSFACQALKDLDLYGQIPIISIAKKLEEIYYPDDEFPIHLSKKSESLKLIQQLRDEAHRFGITFHRELRSKNSLTSVLDTIEGIGKTSVEKLLVKYKTIKKIQAASDEELAELIGKQRIAALRNALKEVGKSNSTPNQKF